MPGIHFYGHVVQWSVPRELYGLYWGFYMRVAGSLLEALFGGARLTGLESGAW